MNASAIMDLHYKVVSKLLDTFRVFDLKEFSNSQLNELHSITHLLYD